MSFYLVYACLLGLMVALWLSIIIYRLPINQSIIKGGSYCHKCHEKLKWFDQIPILSWLLLNKRCRYCSSVISYRYPLIETLTGLTFLLSVFAVDLNPNETVLELSIVKGFILTSTLITITFIDIDHLIIPDSIISIGFISGIAITCLSYYPNKLSIIFYRLINNNILSSLIGLFTFLLISYTAKLIMGKTSLGIGDAKLISLSGLWLGLDGLILVMTNTFLLSGLFALVGIITNRLRIGEQFALAPYIAISTFMVWLLGDKFWIDIISSI